MRTIEPILLSGDYDWDSGLLSSEEYAERLKAVRAELAARTCAGLVLEGDGEDHANLAYLTGYAPKLGPSAMAIIPTEGKVQLFFPGGGTMAPAARRQTWVSDVQVLNDPRPVIAKWLEPIQSGKAVALAGSSFMQAGFCRAFRDAIGPSRGIVRLDQRLEQMRRRKSQREREALRRAALILKQTVNAFASEIGTGGGTRTALIATERTAHRLGAQDVRVLASASDGGTPWPFDRGDDPKPNPLHAHIAVRYAGYWSEGLFSLGKPTEAATTAARALDSLIRAMRPGASIPGLVRNVAERIIPYRLHPYVEGAFGTGIGLYPEETPRLAHGVNGTLQANDVMALRVGLAGAGGEAGFASAIVELKDEGADVLWSSAVPRA